ncbi:lipocalin-like domain-containing protein [Ruegeria aquimaris]|uniref:Iron ABC transporter permease n=1 Tax=Ruegeria aquimaris TaxID=2984333 RepID=A0ABT3ASH3_9RHOB|nr:lipocalin-like domain-containing protein [Ruegeria sp. XHP0148]MCV2891247.1 iron ABC transporter permease [Ruegeria sp. XHP0148]
MKIRALLLLLLWPWAVSAQGFAGLGTAAEGFAVPERGVELHFPADHGAHPDFRIEWWYLTATLDGADGRDYGLQWTLFRSALKPGEQEGWQSPQIWMGHAAVTTPDAHYDTERLSRGGIGQAGVAASPFRAWIDEWEMSGDPLGAMRLTAAGPDFVYRLDMQAKGPLVLHGDRGYSVKSQAGQASYYYSQPFLHVSGTLDLPEGPVAVTGSAWIDREWSSQPLSDDQTGWDWFSLVLDDNTRVMAFRLRGSEDFTSGTWIAPDGTATPLANGAIRTTPVRRAAENGPEVPVEWHLEIPSRGLDVQVSALYAGAWMDTSFPYWEGPVTVTGSHAGRGYLEMTGYR